MTEIALPLAIGSAVAGTAISAIGAIRQGQAASNAANYNAGMARMNADIAESQSVAASAALKRDTARKQGAAIAAYGASGVQASEGSAMEVLADSARSAALDDLTLKYNYKLKGLGFLAQAELDRANASSSRTSSYFNAAGSMLNGGSRVASYFI